MNIQLFKRLFFISGVAGILMFVSGRGVHAESLSLSQVDQISEASELDSDVFLSDVDSLQVSPEVSGIADLPDLSANTPTPTVESLYASTEEMSEPTELTADSQASSANTEEALEPVEAAVVETTAASLQSETLTVQAAPVTAPEATTETATPTTVAQVVSPGQSTRSGPSYIAVGGNIGFGGSTGLGQGNFVVTSKVGLTEIFSVRPSALIGEDATFVIPVTVDFPTATVIDEGRLSLAPFVGGGLAISTGENSQVSPVITAGVDVPIADRLTAVASTNIAFFDDVEVGLILGVGYNF